MKEVMLLTLQQFGVLFFFIVVGYLLKVFKLVTDVKSLSTVLMWVFIPALVFNVFYKNFTLTNFSAAMPYALAGCVLLFLMLGISYPLVKKYKDRITRNTYWYSLVITNMSYVGFPLIKNVFPEMEMFFMVFIMGFQIYIFTVGAAMFKPERQKFSLKGLLSPILIATFAGMACGLLFDKFSVKMPVIIDNVLTSAANCMSPAAMLITGFTLAKLPVKKVFSSGNVYFFTALRLIVFPLAIGGLAYLLQIAAGLPIGIVKIITIYLALPFGINSVVFAEANGADGKIGAQCAFISHLGCILTLPLIFALISAL